MPRMDGLYAEDMSYDQPLSEGPLGALQQGSASGIYSKAEDEMGTADNGKVPEGFEKRHEDDEEGADGVTAVHVNDREDIKDDRDEDKQDPNNANNDADAGISARDAEREQAEGEEEGENDNDEEEGGEDDEDEEDDEEDDEEGDEEEARPRKKVLLQQPG